MMVLGMGWGSANQAQAQSRQGTDVGLVKRLMNTPSNGLNLPAQMTPYVRFGMPSNDPNGQRQTLEALVGSSVEPLKWPELPRVWWRFEGYKGTTQTYYSGIQWSERRISGAYKNALVYKYNRSISFVLIGSLRSDKQTQAPNTVVGNQIDMQHLVVEDNASGMMYPNVRDDYPMVGMCMYDLSMATESTRSFSFDIVGNGASNESVEGFGTPFTLYSNFFQLDGNKPIISHYVMKHCQKMFETAVKGWVETQFSKAQRAYRTETMSTCKRERGGTDRTTVGDRGCFAWHSDLPSDIQKNTTPRCERMEDDLFHCTLKTRFAGGTCPMRQGNDAKIVPSLVMGNIRGNPATGAKPSAPCDEDQGLVCVPTLPKENVANLEKNRLFLSQDQLQQLGICQQKNFTGPRAP